MLRRSIILIRLFFDIFTSFIKVLVLCLFNIIPCITLSLLRSFALPRSS